MRGEEKMNRRLVSYCWLLVMSGPLVGGCSQTQSDTPQQMATNVKPKVLFLCTGNSCRSQMAEGWARQLLGDRAEYYSAGVEAKGLNPYAARVMQEVGVDITSQTSKLADTLKDVPFDLVVTV